jgi:hypothetical protein
VRSPLLVCTLDARRFAWMPQFVAHYKELGVERFLLTLHTAPELDEAERARQREAFRALVADLDAGEPQDLVCDFSAKAVIRNERILVQAHAGPADWILWCDSDEWQLWPEPVPAMVERLRAQSLHYASGFLIDRVAQDWSLAPFLPQQPVEATYPRSCNATYALLRGEIRKVVLAHRDVQVGPGHHVVREPLRWRRLPRYVQIHHYKWDDTVIDRLRARLTPEYRALSPDWGESQRILDYFEAHGGRFDPADLEEWTFAGRELVNASFE